MPIRRSMPKLTKAQEQHARSRLREMGIPVQEVCDDSQVRDRITVEPVRYDEATFYELVFEEVAVVLPVSIMVRTSRIVITDCGIRTPYSDFLLNVPDPDEIPSYVERLVGESPYLNSLLVKGRPLGLGKHPGVIVGHGMGPIPAEYRHGSLVDAELLLWDHRDNEVSFTFKARVDRSQVQKYMPRPIRPSNRVPLCKPVVRLRDQTEHKAIDGPIGPSPRAYPNTSQPESRDR